MYVCRLISVLAGCTCCLTWQQASLLSVHKNKIYGSRCVTKRDPETPSGSLLNFPVVYYYAVLYICCELGHIMSWHCLSVWVLSVRIHSLTWADLYETWVHCTETIFKIYILANVKLSSKSY